MAKKQQKAQKWMGDQKPAKTREMTKRQNQKSQEEKPIQYKIGKQQRMAYPRLRQETEHKSLGGSPEKQPKNQDESYIHKTPASLSNNACEHRKSTYDTKTQVISCYC